MVDLILVMVNVSIVQDKMVHTIKTTMRIIIHKIQGMMAIYRKASASEYAKFPKDSPRPKLPYTFVWVEKLKAPQECSKETYVHRCVF